MSSSPQKWMAFLDDGILDDPPQPNSLYWCGFNEQADLSVDNSSSKVQVDDQEKLSSKKRFLELSTLLEPGRTPKTDKIVILADALRALKQLKAEAQELGESNEKLRDTIKKFKMEKSELRDEKQRLKAEKEKLEQQIKLTSMSPHGYPPHPAALHAAAMMAFSHSQPTNVKGVSIPNYPGMGMGMGMWQWMPPAALDTSQDHRLRPPVA